MDFRARLCHAIARQQQNKIGPFWFPRHPVRMGRRDLDVLAEGIRGLSSNAVEEPYALYGVMLVICTWFYGTDDRDALNGTSAGDLLERMVHHYTTVLGHTIQPVRWPTGRTSPRWRSEFRG